MEVFISVMIHSFIKSKSDTELFHLLRRDHTHGMILPGLGHLPHLAPGEGPGVKLEDGGLVPVVPMVDECEASCMRLQLSRIGMIMLFSHQWR